MIEIPDGIDPRQVLDDLDRIDVEQSLYQFIKRAWKYMDPSPWKDGWHIGAIAEHLEAVVDGEITRLLINLPPRHGKSLTVAVAFPAWTWAQPKFTHTSGPGVQFLYGSYADKLSLRDSVKCRRLIESPWYQKYFSSRFQLVIDNNTKSRFANDQGGERLITSIGAGVTGEGGNIICFPRNEMVHTEIGNIPIGEIVEKKLKLRVWSFNHATHRSELKPITGWFKNPGSLIVRVLFNDGTSLRCTPNHKIWTQRGWVEATHLTSLDIVVGKTKERWHTFLGVDRYELETFCLEVEGNHNFYIGDGVALVSNCIDDPNAANEIASEATTATTLDWWSTTMQTRTNDPDLSAFVIIQQRLAKNDLSGHVLEKEQGWTHLCLPGRFEKDRAFVTTIGWSDPRTEEGELLWPERFSEKALQRLELTMGPFTFAGQIQQRPAPKGGGIIKEEWWNLWDKESYPAMDFILATLDTAYTSKEENDPSALIVWGVFRGQNIAHASRAIDRDGRPQYIERTVSEGLPRVMCMHSWSARLELHELVKKVATTCKALKVDMLKIENKSAGHSVEQELRRLYANESFSVQFFDPKSQDKKARLYSVQNFFAAGMIYAPDTTWAREVIDQCQVFDKGDHDDLVDCVSMGLRTLRELGLLEMQAEVELHEESLKAYPGRQQALYNC